MKVKWFPDYTVSQKNTEKLNVAILSPDQNAYSETFIQAHKKINAKVFFYYGGSVPNHLEGIGLLKPKPGTVKWWLIKFFHRIQGDKLPVAGVIIKKSFKKEKINIVLAEYGTTGAEIVPVCKKMKMPLITIFHGFDASVNEIVKEYQNKYLDLFNHARKILVVSEVMKNKLISIGCPPYKIIKTVCSPNNKFLKLVPTFTETQSFVSIGRFVNKKAPYYTILAIKKVTESYPNVKLYFAGIGELLETTENLVKYLKLENNVIFLGIITPDEYASLLTRVTGFILHSITAKNGDMEGTPVSILEASAAGIPVISTRHAGIKEVIIEGQTGLLVNEHDVDSMADCIIKLIENIDYAKELGNQGKLNIERNFSMDSHLSIINNSLYDAV